MADENDVEKKAEELRQRIEALKTGIAASLNQLIAAFGSLKTNLTTAAADFQNGPEKKPSAEILARQGSRASRMRRQFWIIPAIMLILSACTVGWLEEFAQKELLDDLRAQLTFLGFVVALASYLASVTRESIKVLKDDPDRNAREDRKDDLSYVTTGEKQLVLLGLIAVARISLSAVGAKIPVLNWIPLGYTDHALIIYLGVIICYLAWVHKRQWDKIK